MSKIEPPEDPSPQILVAEKGEIQWQRIGWVGKPVKDDDGNRWIGLFVKVKP